MPAFFHFNTLEAPLTWEIGEDIPDMPKKRGIAVLQVRANGRELDHIRYHIHGIRDANRPTVTWFGDDAQFIYHNLPSHVQ